MIDFKRELVKLRSIGFMKGKRPIFVDVMKGSYSYKGCYLVTTDEENIYFYQLKPGYKYKAKKTIDFMIPYDALKGYQFQFYKTFYKKITLIFKNGLEFPFNFLCDCEESYDNEANANYFMATLKEKGVCHMNVLKEGKHGQKVISKGDQLSVKEIRSPSQKRGFFQ